MDGSHLTLAGLGLAVGWWVSGGSHQRPEPHICRCHCASVPERPSGEPLLFWLAVVAVIVIAGANLVFIFRVTLRQTETGQEVTLAVKGRPGKGVFGSSRGLQI